MGKCRSTPKIRNSAEFSRIKKLAGFTLVELIVVITILAILATIGFLALSGYSQDAKDSSIKANIRSIQTAIVSESAVSGNSPRHYVMHDVDYALSGAFAYVDWTGVALTGGDVWAAPSNSNYTAGKPNYQKLKLNPDKFRIVSSNIGGALASIPFFSDSAKAAYDPNSAMAAAADFPVSGKDGKKRSASYVQTAWISPATKLASVAGNFPTSDTPSGYVSWLLRAEPANPANLTGALVEWAGMKTVADAPVVICDVNRGQTKWDSLGANQWVCFEDQWGNRIAVWKLVNVATGGNIWDPNKIYTRDAGSSEWIRRTYYWSANLNFANSWWIYSNSENWWAGGTYPSNGANCAWAMLIYCNNCSSSVAWWTVAPPNTPYGNAVWQGVGMCYLPTKMFWFMKTVYTQN